MIGIRRRLRLLEIQKQLHQLGVNDIQIWCYDTPTPSIDYRPTPPKEVGPENWREQFIENLMENFRPLKFGSERRHAQGYYGYSSGNRVSLEGT